jgi:hypothetical protein
VKQVRDNLGGLLAAAHLFAISALSEQVASPTLNLHPKLQPRNLTPDTMGVRKICTKNPACQLINSP